MAWALVCDQLFGATGRPIPPIRFDDLSGSELLLLGTSATAKRSWWLAFRLRIDVALPDAPIELGTVQIHHQRIPLGRPIAIKIPDIANHYSIRLDVPYWLYQLDVKIWQNNTPVIREIRNWKTVADNTVMEVNTAYVAASNRFLNFTLPPDSPIGGQVRVYGSGSANWRIAQNDGQQIRIGDQVSTFGMQGKVEALEPGNLLILEYEGDGMWSATELLGNFELI